MFPGTISLAGGMLRGLAPRRALQSTARRAVPAVHSTNHSYYFARVEMRVTRGGGGGDFRRARMTTNAALEDAAHVTPAAAPERPPWRYERPAQTASSLRTHSRCVDNNT